MRNIYENDLREMLLEHGADLVGFSCVREELPEELKIYPYAVTIVRKLAKAVTNTIQGAPTMIYFQHYRMTNTKLDLLALDAVSFIEKQGYLALPIAASQSTPDDKEAYKGVFPHKTGAVKAGLGFIGKSGVLITEEYGSFVRLATVLTDMPLEPSGTVQMSKCGACTICRDACPAGAITGKEYVPGDARSEIFDAKKCSEHMKTYKHIGRGAVCGICMSVCPYNKK
ncbi:MAG: epoxyqueuosine reductase [Clostridia bacterium]|nr:epoxyqueuosine reductase [Clostridia bacterium]